jgi:hypothetical protein
MNLRLWLLPLRVCLYRPRLLLLLVRLLIILLKNLRKNLNLDLDKVELHHEVMDLDKVELHHEVMDLDKLYHEVKNTE